MQAVDHCVDGRLVSDVCRIGNGFAAEGLDLLYRLFGGFQTKIDAESLRAFLGIDIGCGLAITPPISDGTGAGDNGDFASRRLRLGVSSFGPMGISVSLKIHFCCTGFRA